MVLAKEKSQQIMNITSSHTHISAIQTQRKKDFKVQSPKKVIHTIKHTQSKGLVLRRHINTSWQISVHSFQHITTFYTSRESGSVFLILSHRGLLCADLHPLESSKSATTLPSFHACNQVQQFYDGWINRYREHRGGTSSHLHCQKDHEAHEIRSCTSC